MKCRLGCNIQRVLVYKQKTFVLKMIVGCNPSMTDFSHWNRILWRESVRTRGMVHKWVFISFHGMDLDHTLALHCVVKVGKDSMYGAWMSLTSCYDMYNSNLELHILLGIVVDNVNCQR